jgi:hypothetical protein
MATRSSHLASVCSISARISSLRSRSGGHLDVSDLDAIQQVLAELALRDHLRQVAVGGRQHAHVRANRRRVGADRLNLSVLEESQQQRLHPHAHLRDLVQEDRPAVSLLQLSDLVAVRAGEAALDMAEQLRLEKRFRKRRAIQRNEALVRPRRTGVDEPGDHVLPDATLTGNEDLRVALGHALRHLDEPFQSVALADDSGVPRPAGPVLVSRRMSSRCAAQVGEEGS